MSIHAWTLALIISHAQGEREKSVCEFLDRSPLRAKVNEQDGGQSRWGGYGESIYEGLFAALWRETFRVLWFIPTSLLLLSLSFTFPFFYFFFSPLY